MDRRQRTEGIRGGAFQILARPDQAAEGRNRRRRQGLAEKESRSRLGLPALAEGIWRARRHPPRAGGLATGGKGFMEAEAAAPQRPGGVRADRGGPWPRGGQTPPFST